MKYLKQRKYNLSLRRGLVRGFTLVEVIVAMTVLTIGLLGVASFFANSAKLGRMASNESIASNLAQGYIDDQVAESYANTTVGVFPEPAERVTNDPNSQLYNFYQQTTVSLIDTDLNPSATDMGLKKIQVVITYKEGADDKNVTMATIKAER